MGRLLWRPAGPGAAAARPEGDCTVCIMYVEPIEVYAWRVHDVHVFACETACVRKCKPVDDRTITIPQQASVNEPTLKCEMYRMSKRYIWVGRVSKALRSPPQRILCRPRRCSLAAAAAAVVEAGVIHV